MTGKGHIVSGTIFMADTYLCDFCLTHSNLSASFFTNVLDFMHDELNPIEYFMDKDFHLALKIFLISMCVLIYYLGNLLPDIDLEHSLISKILHVHLPVVHRGITHSDWVVLIFIVLAFKVYLFRFFALGYVAHLFIDSFSKAGRVPFYPLGKYYVRNNIAISKRKHITLYSSEDNSEFVVLFIMSIVSIAVAGFAVYMFLM